jgi:hypothetical protein
MALKVNEHIFAGEQAVAAEAYFKCKLPGYVEACALSMDTVNVGMMEGVGKNPLSWLFNSMFAAGFIVGSMYAQGKGELAMRWLAKQKPRLADGK